ncbi:MAG TPA: hypothetical protein VF578_04985, partial [Methylomirabilota bacterium]
MRAALITVLALELTGCAAQVTPPYSDAERARVDEYERAAERVLISREIAGRPPSVQVGSDPALVSAGHPAAYYQRRPALTGIGRPG